MAKRQRRGTHAAPVAQTSGGKGHRGWRRVLSTILIVVGIGLLIVAAGIWGFNQYRYWRQDQVTKEMAQKYVTEPSSADSSAAASAPTVDWESLKAMNDEAVGWIEVPGTVVNYAVFQHSDNSFYLTHGPSKEYDVFGQVFMDYQNTAPGMVDQQTILYGHHLKNGTMFQPLFLLKDQETFDNTPTVWYLTEGASYELEPLFVYFTDPNDTTVRQFSFSSDEEFRSYLTERLAKAVSRRADAEQIIQGTSHVLTLSTCNYYEGYGRSILVCVPKSEASAATAASN